MLHCVPFPCIVEDGNASKVTLSAEKESKDIGDILVLTL